MEVSPTPRKESKPRKKKKKKKKKGERSDGDAMQMDSNSECSNQNVMKDKDRSNDPKVPLSNGEDQESIAVGIRETKTNTAPKELTRNSVNSSDEKLSTGSDWFTPLHAISSGSGSDKRRLKDLKSRGIVPKMGKWGSDEVEQLHENLMRFLSCHKIKDFCRLILPQTKEDLLFRKENDFVLSMCHGIQRTRSNIRNRIEQQYSNFLKKGTLSVQEREKLVKLQKIFGNKWQKIGYLMSRYHRCMSTNYRYAVGNWNKGPWSGEEDKLLIAAVTPYLEKNETISWSQVTKIVGTRSLNTCQQRWTRQLSKRLHRSTAEIFFNSDVAYELVCYIYNLNVDDDYLVNWTEVASHFQERYKPGWLRCKFQALLKEVPSSHLLEFDDAVEKLYNIYEEKKKGF